MVLRRKTEKAVSQLIWLGFFILPIIGFSISWWLRFKSGIFEVIDFQPYSEYKIPILIVALFWAFVYGARKVQKPDLSVGAGKEFTNIAWSSVIAMIFPMALSFAYRGYFYSRLV
ncbi:hypothetical protein DRQ33_07080, partial [bacterium]